MHAFSLLCVVVLGTFARVAASAHIAGRALKDDGGCCSCCNEACTDCRDLRDPAPSSCPLCDCTFENGPFDVCSEPCDAVVTDFGPCAGSSDGSNPAQCDADEVEAALTFSSDSCGCPRVLIAPSAEQAGFASWSGMSQPLGIGSVPTFPPGMWTYGLFTRDSPNGSAAVYSKAGLDFLKLSWSGEHWTVSTDARDAATGYTSEEYVWSRLCSPLCAEEADGTFTALRIYHQEGEELEPGSSDCELVGQCPLDMGITCLAATEEPAHVVEDYMKQCGLLPKGEALPKELATGLTQPFLNYDRWRLQWGRLAELRSMPVEENYYNTSRLAWSMSPRRTTFPFVVSLLMLFMWLAFVLSLLRELALLLLRVSGCGARFVRFKRQKVQIGGPYMPLFAYGLAFLVPILAIAARSAHMAAFMRDNAEHPTCFASGFNVHMATFSPYASAPLGLNSVGERLSDSPGFLSAAGKSPSEWARQLRAFGVAATSDWGAQYSYFSVLDARANSRLHTPIPDGRLYLETALPLHLLHSRPWGYMTTIHYCDPSGSVVGSVCGIGVVKAFSWWQKGARGALCKRSEPGQLCVRPL